MVHMIAEVAVCLPVHKCVPNRTDFLRNNQSLLYHFWLFMQCDRITVTTLLRPFGFLIAQVLMHSFSIIDNLPVLVQYLPFWRKTTSAD